MTTEGFFVDSAPASTSTTGGSNVEGGFVKGVVTYMVLDNLEVKPMSTISSIALLNEFNVQNVFYDKTLSQSLNIKGDTSIVYYHQKTSLKEPASHGSTKIAAVEALTQKLTNCFSQKLAKTS
ncbi:hypothetical protein JRO89_XS14G0056200 [Xanthoceras sorbifolium]|uniref:Uncharacterized protein n=1 Tax=Xanthoceras sorbifolium TaxID=99658 RepID=A0ABQ8H3Z0_9ROSI|nr:hypothetical protein JRO89_XS14G0056200 [Xanthoceras sorbifolium]